MDLGQAKQRNIIVYRLGALCAGATMFIVTNIWRFVKDPATLHSSLVPLWLLASFVICIVGGYVWGLVMWRMLERLQIRFGPK